MTTQTAKPHDNFMGRLFSFALPLILQYLIISCLNLVDNVMIGRLGEISISGVGLGNQVFFLANLFMVGITGGATIFMAQFWGKKDVDSIHKSMGLSWILTLAIGAFFTTAGTVFPKAVISIYTNDALVIAEGARYLKLAALSYIPFAIMIVLVTALRSTGNVRVPLLTSIIALSLNTFLNYCLIFGNFGMPELGVRGAAIATTIARSVEVILLLIITYGKKFEIAAPIAEYFRFSKEFVGKLMRKISLVLLNESTWALGTTCYSIIYGRMGTMELTIMNICGVVFNISFVFALGVGQALGIMIGNNLGAKDFDKAKRDARRGLPTAFILGLIVSSVMIFLRPQILSLYNVAPQVTAGANTILLIMLAILPINCLEFTLFIGILRAGGDTVFCAIVDVAALWLVGLPLAFTGAFVFYLPIMFVYMMARMESFSRAISCYVRYRSMKWVKDIT